jgi:hypothetical protein
VKSIICFLFTVVFIISGYGQTGNDSADSETVTVRQTPPRRPARSAVIKRTNDTPVRTIDSTSLKRKRKAVPGVSYRTVLKQNPYFNFFGKPILQTSSKREINSKDGLFYLLIGVLLYFALIRVLFFRYLDNLFTLFFRASLKQKQIREQLLQTPLPSLLLNILFVVIGGIYASFLFRNYKLFNSVPLPLLMIYGTLALSLIYFTKFVTLKFLGWIFNIVEATDMYIFIVFMVNKLLGIFLLPFIALMAFSGPAVLKLLVTLSILLIIIAFVYRYILAFASIRKQVNVSQFHFFLYLCGFEITPLLIIYKVLLSFFARSL